MSGSNISLLAEFTVDDITSEDIPDDATMEVKTRGWQMISDV
jgi:hypothetical protein